MPDQRKKAENSIKSPGSGQGLPGSYCRATPTIAIVAPLASLRGVRNLILTAVGLAFRHEHAKAISRKPRSAGVGREL